jgi:hypothetical protein
MPLTDPDVAKEFFIITIWSERNFEYIWFWMKNYLDIRKSSELRCFNKRKSPLSQPCLKLTVIQRYMGPFVMRRF